jgi:phenylpropionate dioxygenase-like ring-hydroxylating dioxygenase large terminal subunit
MKSQMPPEAYISQEWFEREQAKVFRPLWQFVAPRMLLAKPDAFVRRRLGGTDVIIQNIEGRLCAFENICAHRQSPLQTNDQGIRPLVCPYHAWRYGSQGEVLNIPFERDCYRFSDEEKGALRIRKFQVFEFGQLVFVNLGDKPLNFWTQFDREAVQSLLRASEIFDSEVLVTRFSGAFNWKLAYENLRDSLHPRFLHTQTVYQQVKFDARIDENALSKTNIYRQYGSQDVAEHLAWLRTFSGGGLNEPISKLPTYPWHAYVKRYGEDDWYLNWLMYPNLHVASGSAGYSFIIEHHIPISANQTDLWVYYVTGRKIRKYPTSTAVLLAHLAGAEKVLAEDISIMEKVQLNLNTNSPRATTGDFEHSNMAIEKWYLDTMNDQYART